MKSNKTIEEGVVTIDLEMESSDEDSVELLEAEQSFDELVKVLGRKYIQEVLEVDEDEENLEELDVFEEENFGDTDIVRKVFDVDDEPLTCQYFTANEWVKYYQLASYFCEVVITGTEEQMETGKKITCLSDNSIELVNLTES